MADIIKPPLPPPGKFSVWSRIRPSRVRAFLLLCICLLFVFQQTTFSLLGSRAAGALLVEALAIFADLFAIACCVVVALKTGGPSQTFWFLLGSVALMELIGNAGWDYCRYFHIVVRDGALFPSLFYRLAAAPMAIALFLSDESRTSKVGSLLDSCMVVGLVGVATYQLQMAEVNAHDPKIWQLIGLGTAANGLLAMCATARYALLAKGYLRMLFLRQAIYLSAYCLISFATGLADAYYPANAASLDLLWILPSLTIAALAVTSNPPAPGEKAQVQRISRRTSLLCFNLTLAAMVTGSAALGLRLVDSSRVVGLIAVSLVLFSFAFRSALLQDAQEKNLEELQKSRTVLEERALYDDLTGLPNRRLLSDRLFQMLALAEREGFIVAVYYLDLDNFKPVNDRFGHRVGDLLLKQVASRMVGLIRNSDTVARIGGDEFIWAVAHVTNRAEATQLCEGMADFLSAPFYIEEHVIQITASIGTALFPEDSLCSSGLLQRADAAMYSVKQKGASRSASRISELAVAG